MGLNREQIIAELEGLVNFITCPEYIKNALYLIRELTEENEKLKYTSLTSITMEQALTRIRRLQREKEEAVHKTLARVKIKCQRVAYADMATGKMRETFTIKGEDLDAIEKELLEGEKCLSK